ncbi:MAG: CpsD/CapB family tyrosine-protein kinase [Erysipelotrichaceae bacterium]
MGNLKSMFTKKKKQQQKSQYDYAEIYRQLRTNIEYAAIEKEVKVISITSTAPNEAKSTVAANLASVYATKYPKTLLIDCDLRKPTVHKIMKVSNKLGLANLIKDLRLLDGKILDSNYIKKAKSPLTQDEIYVLTAGPKVYNPAEVLSSERFKSIIARLREEFDVIIIDTPPTLAVSDSVYVSHQCDGTLFVISSKETEKQHAKHALTQLKRNGVNILGAVCTKVEKERVGAYGYYYYGYSEHAATR